MSDELIEVTEQKSSAVRRPLPACVSSPMSSSDTIRSSSCGRGTGIR